MAALSTTANGGLIPQARHGGRGKEALANEASKFEGTGFEKEQIVHIQVAFDWGKGEDIRGASKGLMLLDTGDEEKAAAAGLLLSV